MEILGPNNNNYKLKIRNTDDDKQCRLRFIDCHKNYPLQNLNKKELKSFIEFAKKVEKQTWRNIKFDDRSLNYEVLKNKKLPDNSNGYIYCESMRVSQKFRVIGYRNNEYFYIVWFDNNHKEC